MAISNTSEAASPGALDRPSARLNDRLFLRLMPLLVAAYVLNFLDRTDIALAKAALRTHAGTSPAAVCRATAPFLPIAGGAADISRGAVRGVALAAGLGFLNGLGIIGGFLGPYVMGLVEQATGNASTACGWCALRWRRRRWHPCGWSLRRRMRAEVRAASFGLSRGAGRAMGRRGCPRRLQT